KPAVVVDPASEMDLFPTVVALAGGELPRDRPIDGVDLRPALTGSGPVPSPVLFYYWDNQLRAGRQGADKARFITSRAYGAGEPRREHDPPLLYNLTEDAGERRDIAAAHPDIVADLLREAAAHRKAMVPGKPLFDELLPAGANPFSR